MAATRRPPDPVVPTAIGAISGGLAGFAIWMVTDAFVFLPVFLAAGLVAGMAIGQSRRS